MIKGEIWWADLPTDPYGSEPGKSRPVLIIQRDAINRSNIRTILCAMITSNTKQAQIQGNILLEKAVSGLEKTSVVNFSCVFFGLHEHYLAVPDCTCQVAPCHANPYRRRPCVAGLSRYGVFKVRVTLVVVKKPVF
jgi:mRNA interferase MazF